MKILLTTVAMAFIISSGLAQAGGKSSASDSPRFGVEREMKESGEKGGTADINIGVGELQESKSGHKIHKGGIDKKTEKKSGKKSSDMDLDDFDSRRSLNIGP